MRVLCVVKGFGEKSSQKQEQMCQCGTCDKRFGTQPRLKGHQKVHFALEEFVCDQCEKGFIQKAKLEKQASQYLPLTKP